MSFWDLFKKDHATILQPFPSITLSEIPKASIGLFYGGTKITEIVGNREYHHPYKPAAFHANIVIGYNRVKNINKESTVEVLSEMCKSTRRIDILIRKDLTDHDRDVIMWRALSNVGKNQYDVGGFLHAVFKFIKPSKKEEFCSDDVTLSFLGKAGDEARVRVSSQDHDLTYPWHLLEYALANLPLYDIRTLFIGPDYAKKYGLAPIEVL